MQLLSAHTSLGLVLATVIVVALIAFGVPVLAAIILGGLGSWLLVQTVFKGFADRAEHWLTTPK